MKESLKGVSKESIADKDKSLTAILYLLQENLEKFKNEVDTTYQLHTKIGEKTSLAKQIIKTIENPIENLSGISSVIEANCYLIIDKIAIKFFSTNKDILKNVYRSKNNSQLHYSIILTQDNPVNRNAIFHFFDMPIINEILYKFPVFFQFTTEETIKQVLPAIEKIDF